MCAFLSAINFGNSTTEKVTIPSTSEFSNLNNFTIGFWARSPSYVYNRGIFGGTSWPPTNDLIYITQWYGGVTINMSDGSTSTAVSYDFDNTDTNWHHYIATFDNGVIKTYTDGVYSGNSATASFTATKVSAGELVIGDVTSRVSAGFLSNIQLFNSTLPETGSDSIEALYNNGSPLVDVSSFTSLRSWFKLDNTTTGVQDAGPANLGGSGSSNIVAVPTIVNTSVARSSGMTTQNLVNNNVSTFNGESSGMDTTNLVQSNLTRKQPFSSYSIYFPGTADTMIANNIRPVNTMTVSQWLKAGTHVGTTYSIATLGGNTNWAGFSMYHPSASTLQFQIQTSDTPYTTTSVDISDGNWHHVVGTYDGSEIRIYFDGVDQGSPTAVTGDISYRNADIVDIGSYFNGSLDFNGNISNTAIWNTALNADDILNLYNNGVPQDLNNFRITPNAWYPMDESYTYFNGSVIVARDVINGNDAEGVNLIQENIIGNAPGSSSNGTGNNLTIANLKGDMKNSTNNSYSINMADYANGVTNPADSGRSTNVP